MRLSILVLVLWAGVGMGVSAAYDEHEFCLGDARAERVSCQAAYYDGLSGCLGDLNFDLWVADHPEDLPQSTVDAATAQADFISCKAEVLQARTECKAEIDTCQEE